MRIDVHAHYWSDDYLNLATALGKTDTATQRGIGAGGGHELTARLHLMDSAGVDRQVLSPAPQLPYSAEVRNGVAAARHINDEYCEIVRRHPDRFAAFASLPLPDIDTSLTELDRALDELGMAGVAMTATVLGHALVDPRFEPIFSALDDRGGILSLHPVGNGACSPLITDYSLTWMLGALMEDSIAVLQLITKGYLLRYPRIRIINSHLGGALPMLLRRADDHVPWEAPDIAELPSIAAKRMWYDTVTHCHVPALRAAIDSLGADRLLLGTDFPYEDGDTFRRAVSYIDDAASTPSEAAAIAGGNAQALLGLSD